MLSLPSEATVVEVGPRDGLQSLDRWVPTDDKVRIVDRLSAAGFPVIEVTGFAHPRVIPNLRDAEEVMARIERHPGTVYRALVPNARGAQRAATAGVDAMVGLITVSETYTAKNQNMTVDQGIAEAAAAFEVATKAGIPFVMAVGMAFFCPYEGRISEDRTESVVGRLREHGIQRFYVAGSLGVEDPRHVEGLVSRLRHRWPDIDLGFHVHNLAGFGMANAVAALVGGASWLEGSICGIGGGIAMPTTVSGVGNLATEDLVHVLNEMGVRTGIDTEAALSASRDIAGILGMEPASHLAHSGTRAEVMERGRQSPRHHPD